MAIRGRTKGSLLESHTYLQLIALHAAMLFSSPCNLLRETTGTVC
jgi:hypothetical protein